MGLTNDDVRHVARLARLGLTDEEVEALHGDLSAILAYAEKVGEVATADVPPTGHPFGLVNVMREDVPAAPLDVAEVLATAPEAEEGRFRVPRLVSEEPTGREDT